MNDHLLFRDVCAENGIELTPIEAKKFHRAYNALREEIRDAVAVNPTFYQELCNRTTEQKLMDMEEMREQGAPMTLREYNELQAMVKKICEIEGYA